MPNRAYELSGQETLDEIAKFSPEMQQTKELTELKTSAEQKLKTDVASPTSTSCRTTPKESPYRSSR